MIAKLAVVILVSVVLLGAVGAWAAGLSVGGVDVLGSGTADVNPPCSIGDVPCPDESDVVVSDVEWFLNLGDTCGDSSMVSLVAITMESLSASTQFDTIRFQLSGPGGVLAQSGNQFDGNTYDGLPEHTFEWDLTAAPTTPAGCVSAADITGFSITVVDEN